MRYGRNSLLLKSSSTDRGDARKSKTTAGPQVSIVSNPDPFRHFIIGRGRIGSGNTLYHFLCHGPQVRGQSDCRTLYKCISHAEEFCLLPFSIYAYVYLLVAYAFLVNYSAPLTQKVVWRVARSFFALVSFAAHHFC